MPRSNPGQGISCSANLLKPPFPPWEKAQPVPPAADKEKVEAMGDEFYSIRGRDLSTGVPTNSKLKELGLDNVAEGLAGDRSIEKKQ